jgi:DNA-binding Xre family transcriptional regulator
MKLKNRVEELLKIKERTEGRKISRQKCAAETGVSLTSVQNWASNSITQYGADQILAFCQYFKCQPGDLFVIVEEPQDEEGQKEALLALPA